MLKKVKFVRRDSKAKEESPFQKQLQDGEYVYKSCEFTFNALSEEYDWLVIIDDMPKIVPNRTELLKCPKENTILVTTEPSSITRYGRGFAGQFEYLITNQEEEVLPHRNCIRSQTGNIWMYGKSYNQIVNDTKIEKTQLISTVCSNKQDGHTMHKLRYDFTKRLQEEIEGIERFGWGYRPIDTKVEALDPYKFHVAIENHIAPNVWTEKLADTFLAYCVPIYCGCPNVYDYFPEDSLITIDINDFDGSIEKIKKIIETPGEYERRLDAVKEARRRVIEEYNLLAMVNKIVENAPQSKFTPECKIYSRRIMRLRYLPDLFRFFAFRVKNFLRGNFKWK